MIRQGRPELKLICFVDVIIKSKVLVGTDEKIKIESDPLVVLDRLNPTRAYDFNKTGVSPSTRLPFSVFLAGCAQSNAFSYHGCPQSVLRVGSRLALSPGQCCAAGGAVHRLLRGLTLLA